MPAPIKVDLLLSGCDVVTIDGKNQVIRDGAVAVKGNKITWIGKASAARRNVVAKSTIDGSGQIAMPGLIDGHVHTAQTLLRGKIAQIDSRGGKVKIPVWWNYYVPFESMLTDEDVYLSGLLCYANMISVGTTCFFEAGGPHPDAMARAAVDTGIRGIVSLSTIDQGDHWPRSMITTTRKALDANVGLVKRWKGSKGGPDRVQASLSLRQIMTCSPPLIEAMAEAARALDVKIHTHLCEGTYEIDYSLAKFGMRPAEYLQSLGALDRHMHCAHSVLLSENEMDLYVKHKPSACHCAYNNYHIGPHRLLGPVDHLVHAGDLRGLGPARSEQRRSIRRQRPCEHGGDRLGALRRVSGDDDVPECRRARRDRAHAMWDEIESRIGGWTRGQLFLCFVIGALSTIASGQGSPYFSSRCCSKLPALTPMRMEQPWSRAALMTSFTRAELPILPGLMRKHAAPLSGASMARR